MNIPSMLSDTNAMTNKGNVALYLDKYLVEKSKESGFNLKVPVVQYQFFSKV